MMRQVDDTYIDDLAKRFTLRELLAWWAANWATPYSSYIQSWRGKRYVAFAIEDLCARTGIERP